ncbi:MAG: hypothetical protein WC554_09155 [Clostridia bacterium]
MAPSNYQIRERIRNQQGRIFTFKEACEFIDELKNYPTGTDTNIQWYDVKNKNRVVIGTNK